MISLKVIQRKILYVMILFIALQNVSFAIQPNIDELISKSDLIFSGVVTKVEYRKSDSQGGKNPVEPHTFVTYKIRQILLGNYDRDVITLRFAGGLVDAAQGEFKIVRDFPQFDVNDTDILMVHGNTQTACPLVACEFGRYRLIDGLVYSENGFGIEQSRAGEVVYGSPVELEQINTHNIGDIKIRRVSTDSAGEILTETPNSLHQQFTPESFVYFLKQKIQAQRLQAKTNQRVRSADINQAFTIPAYHPIQLRVENNN